MNKCIGIRHEDKYLLERRAPLSPAHVRKLIRENNLKIVVQKSEKRVFSDQEYEASGALLSDNLSECPVIFGVKEVPESSFESKKTYVFFSHVIKGQLYNMPMLKQMMARECNLIDYEKIEDEMGRRLIFFGRYAGLAGMINTLWALGKRLKAKGVETPFNRLRQASAYCCLDEAKEAISAVGFEIAKNGVPKEMQPLVVGFTGYGNVSKGAQEILHLLPVKEISPEALLKLEKQKDLPSNMLFKTVFMEKHISTPVDDSSSFDLNDYYKNPHRYKNQFEKYIPYLSVLVNGMYWDDRYPKLITNKYLQKLYSKCDPKLQVIGDITCDIDGSIESTAKAAPIDEPVFVYNPFDKTINNGFEGKGICSMTVDILPAELPKEASESFGDALFPFVDAIAEADFSKPFHALSLPGPIKNALILHQGKLTPDFEYMNQYL